MNVADFTILIQPHWLSFEWKYSYLRCAFFSTRTPYRVNKRQSHFQWNHHFDFSRRVFHSRWKSASDWFRFEAESNRAINCHLSFVNCTDDNDKGKSSSDIKRLLKRFRRRTWWCFSVSEPPTAHINDALMPKCCQMYFEFGHVESLLRNGSGNFAMYRGWILIVLRIGFCEVSQFFFFNWD